MLEDYKLEQPDFYNIITKAKINNSVSHAYLIETNNVKDSMKLVMNFAKFLLCNNKECGSCNICTLIDNNSYSDFEIISPDGQWVKKEQLLNIQEKYKTKSLNNQKRIYVITDAAALNKSSANSLLKFLEEPTSDVVAILMVDNRYRVLPTILSRCQVIALKKNNDHEEIDSKLYGQACLFLETVCMKKTNALAYTKELFHDISTTKEEQERFLTTLENINFEFYKYQLDSSYHFVYEYDPKLIKIIMDNGMLKTLNMVSLIEETRKLLKYNVNIKLLIDKLIIEMVEVINNG